MASGVSHGINNMLTPILAYAEQVLNHRNMALEVKGDVLRIHSAALEIANPVSRIQDFYRGASAPFGSVCLDKVVRDAADLTELRWKSIPEQIGHNISMTVSTDRHLFPLRGSETDLHQDVVNSILKAVEAMPQGGQRTVKVNLRDPGDVSSSIIYEIYNEVGRTPSQFIAIEVSDTGIGMDEETQRKCNERFFTTKEATGFGLGLCIALAATKRHGGYLGVESQSNKESIFRMLLPVFREPVTQTFVPAVEPIQKTPLRSLLVDDEMPVLKAVSEMLKRSGDRVQLAMGR
ncbi:MAG: sensor histidine kinase [bacterium JZ-2024 1]